jgi:hypothetical protein
MPVAGDAVVRVTSTAPVVSTLVGTRGGLGFALAPSLPGLELVARNVAQSQWRVVNTSTQPTTVTLRDLTDRRHVDVEHLGRYGVVTLDLGTRWSAQAVVAITGAHALVTVTTATSLADALRGR